MSRVDETPVHEKPTDGGFVAGELPSTAPMPEPARTIRFRRAFLLFWLLPKRYGPHLAAGSLRRALAAHVLAAVLAGLVIAAAVVDAPIAFTLDPHQLRVSLAEFVFLAAAASAGTGWSSLSALAVLGCVPLAEACLVIVGTILMPWCAGGDRASSVWRRSVKNVYWSTTTVLPAAILFAVVYSTGERWGQQGLTDSAEMAVLGGAVALVVGVVVLFARPFVVGAHRYVGLPDGPAFAPREPRCDGCGYMIVGLPPDANCPECGLPVRQSLPGGRRRPPRWQTLQFRPSGWFELMGMQATVLRGTDVFRTIPVHEGLSAARHFWWGTLALFALAILLTLGVAQRVAVVRSELYGAAGTFSILLICLPLAAQSLVMSAAGLRYQVQYGIRDYRVSAIVCYYASPLMWPLVVIALAGCVTMTDPIRSSLADWDFPLGPGTVRWDCSEVAAFGLVVMAVLAVLFWWWRLGAAMRAVRYANV